MIKTEESYSLFINTLAKLDENKLALSDKELNFEIFEELDSDHHTFLHSWTIDRLIAAGLVPKILRSRILALRANISMTLKKSNSIDFYRNEKEWKVIRVEAHVLMSEIKAHSL